MAPPDKNRLARRLTDTRQAVDHTLADWRRRLDVGARIRERPALSVAVGASGGFVLGHWWPRRPTGPGRARARTGTHPVVTVLRTALTLGRPVLSAYFASRQSGPSSDPPAADFQPPDPTAP